ncbi:hypothetical protein PABG_01593 [Paracoccidioides brasiliensis Pb03]|nr:hypothetical protein PABG_01593 [Paracoccidioides brasiliensis Pb03]
MRIHFAPVLLGISCAAAYVARSPEHLLDLTPRVWKKAEICKLPFTGVSQMTLNNTWGKSGAGEFLDKFLKKYGTKNWTNKFFQHTVNMGKHGGSTFNCMSYPGGGPCSTPESSACETYNPPEAFFVHQSLGMLKGALDRIHESIQNFMISALLEDIQNAVDIFGPPESENRYIWSLMIGVFVSAVAFTGPVWQIGAPLTGVVGALNLAAGAEAKNAKPVRPADFKKLTEKDVNRFFTSIERALKETVEAVFGGKFESVGEIEDKVKWIGGIFSEGKMMDNTKLEPAINTYTNAIAAMIRCTAIVKRTEDHLSPGPQILMTEKMYNSFTNYYGFDYKTALTNAVDCAVKKGSGSPDWTKLPSFTQKSKWPECFVNLPVKDENFFGEYQPKTPNPKNPWRSGWCGLHITQYQKNQNQKGWKTGKDFEFDVKIFDAEQKEIGSAKREKANTGKSFGIGSMLPYKLIVTAGKYDSSPIEFAYAGAHWDSDNRKQCKISAMYDKGGLHWIAVLERDLHPTLKTFSSALGGSRAMQKP